MLSTTGIGPFTVSSTFVIKDGYTMPRDLITGCVLYPIADCNPPYYIKRFYKDFYNDRHVFYIADNTGSEVLSVIFASKNNDIIPNMLNSNITTGYAMQGDVLCGAMVGCSRLKYFIEALPDTIEFDKDAFIFRSNVVYNRAHSSVSKSYVKYSGEVVDNITWSDAFNVDTSGVASIVYEPKHVDTETIGIESIKINGKVISNKQNVTIVPYKNSYIRLLQNTGNSITLGRIADKNV